ncbi:hypothetical protein PINS_up002014 [Pythium insidiosum]|nr:hypothetical protein PINS_up002014 [Pythium insidiosum]
MLLGHNPRSRNSAADALCNWIMDQPPDSHRLSGSAWPCGPGYAAATGLLTPLVPHPEDHQFNGIAFHRQAYDLVLTDFRAIAPLVLARFGTSASDLPVHAHAFPLTSAPAVVTRARFEPSEFEFRNQSSCVVGGRQRYVPRDVFDRLEAVAHQVGVRFPRDTAFLTPGPGSRRVPHTDLVILDGLVAHPSMGVARTLTVFRGQTSADQRRCDRGSIVSIFAPTLSSSSCATLRGMVFGRPGGPVTGALALGKFQRTITA